MSRFITLFFFFLLSGCQSVAITDKVYNVKTPQSHIPIALSSPLPESLFKGLSEGTMSTSRLTTYVSYKAFLTPSDTITETPYSYIYFPKPPTTVNLKKQYLQFCEMYMNTFSDKASVVKYLDAENEKVIPVYWFNRLIVKDTSC
ncbi:hypothetical protein, partial [Flavobacterium sp.]|uniref:hypothetical protein n=1 Tax=Flavobacterium sp. TaxID=239 RepID=UPI0037C1044B